MKRPPTKIVDLSPNDAHGLVERIAGRELRNEDYELLKTLVLAYVYIVVQLSKKGAAISRLKKMLFGASTEKTGALVGESEDDSPSPDKEASGESPEDANVEHDPPKQRKGHGRNGADAYRGAEKIAVPHPSLHAGDDCPDCQQGVLYDMSCPGVLIRITGQAPVQAKVYQLHKLRCNLCGKVFTAPPPAGVSPEKYDATTGSIIGLLKYGSGMPFNRFGRLQGSFGIPLAASTQWKIVAGVTPRIEPAYVELIRQAAQGDVVYNDDTTTRILEFMGKRAKRKAFQEAEGEESAGQDASSRTGLFTSGIVSTLQGRKIAVFFSGRKHAGENLADVLRERAADLEPPIQMCDALSRNLPGELKTIMANCLAHGRRYFVEEVERFRDECLYVIKILKVIYKNDATARKQNMSPEERLRFHQAESASVMEELQKWLHRQFDDRLVEPNSSLGEAITYMLNHWDKLTLFLRKAGAPLDNNVCERALKKAILHRKNSYFFRSQRGAHTADVFMSLIYTSELCGANPFHYLTELQRHADEVAANPQDWMPWNYQIALAGVAS